MGRPFKSFERINRIFPECIDKLDDESLSESEKQERATMIENCMKVCKWFVRNAGFEPAVTAEQAAEYNQMMADQELEENLPAALPDTIDFDSEW